ncbi:hypothetical protein LARV_03334 [Longilinea arvoryzae]|uniref:3-keto-disaccharide hydrolase domain-containing protein n=1 Tax=Longilinea arvoryzae TaxID=360412 RepID=A0A0S7BMP6_9CHLR|nr:hypothetical protein [Longilinea arvoryzae]GAP15544.1 hypothetical protein LARV_03334 [Longilinea arvoryzae]
MKKVLPLFLALVFLLSACSGLPLPGGSTAPTSESDSDMATRVASILTAMPTVTGQAPQQAAQTQTLPTLAPSATLEVATTVATLTQPAPTATTEAPQGTPTENLTPVATFTPQGGATQAPTAVPSGDDPRAKLGKPAWTDTMDGSDNWPTGDSDFTKIDFSGGSLQLTALKTIAGWRLTWPKIGDAYIEMSVRSGNCNSNDYYGIIFRVPDLNDPDQGYLLSVSCDGKYSLRLWNGREGTSGKMTTLIPWTASDKIVSGADQLNRVGAMMIGDRLLVYLNGSLIKEVKDSTFKEGYFGVFAAQGKEQKEFTIRIEEMSYWNNPQP